MKYMKLIISTILLLMLCAAGFGQTRKHSPTPKLHHIVGGKGTNPTPAPTVITEATTKDGKKVILKSDMSWEYATSGEGSVNRVALKKIKLPILNDDVDEVIEYFKIHRFEMLRSQFDTQKDYIERLSKISFNSSKGKKTGADIVFVFSGQNVYDAEKQVFLYSIKGYPSSVNYKYQFIKFLNPVEYTSMTPEFSFGVPISEAKYLTFSLDVAVYGYPTGLYSTASGDSGLSFFVTKVVVFNRDTGDVYHEENYLNKP